MAKEKTNPFNVLIAELRIYSKQHSQQLTKLTERVQENAEQIKSHNGKLNVLMKIFYLILAAWIVALIAQAIQVVF